MSIFNSFLKLFSSETKPAKPKRSISSPPSSSPSSATITSSNSDKDRTDEEKKIFKAQELLKEFFTTEKSFLSSAKIFQKQIKDKNTAGKDYLADIVPEKHLIEIEKIISDIIKTAEEIIALNNQNDGRFGFDTPVNTEPGFNKENRKPLALLILKNQLSIQKLSIIIQHMNEIYELDTKINKERRLFFPEIFQRTFSVKNLLEKMIGRCSEINMSDLSSYFKELYDATSSGIKRYDNAIEFHKKSLSIFYEKASKKSISTKIFNYFSNQKMESNEKQREFFKKLHNKNELDNILEYSLKQLIPNPDVESRLKILKELEDQAIKVNTYCAPPQEIEKQALFERRLEKTMSKINRMKTELKFNYDRYDYTGLDKNIADIKSNLETLNVIIKDENFIEITTEETINKWKIK